MAQKKRGPKKTAAKQPASEESVSYDEFKVYEGQRYTGMKIGRTHTTEPTGVRRYDEREVGLLLKRATELQQGAPSRMTSNGLTLEELADIAAEAGIDVALLRQAAAELDTQPQTRRARLGEALAGERLNFVLERTLPFEARETMFAELLPDLQAASSGGGHAGVVGRTLTWNATYADDPHALNVTVSVRTGATVIRIEERHGESAGAIVGGLGTGVGSAVGIGLGGTLGGVLGSAPLAVLLGAAVIAGGFGISRAAYRRIVRGRHRTLEQLMHNLVARLEAAHAARGSLPEPLR